MIAHKNFIDILESKFSFLQKDFCFDPFKIEDQNLGVFTKTKNKTSGINISLEPRGGGVFTYICALTDKGKFPQYEMSVDATTKLSGFYIEDLMQVNDPKNFKKLKDVDTKYPEQKDCESIFEIHSSYLKNSGSALLNGNFSLFKESDKIVKERVRSMK